MTRLVGKAKARARAKKQQQHLLKPTFCQMIEDVAGDSGNTKENQLAVRMMIQAFVIPNEQIWTDTKYTKNYYGMCVSPEQYQSFIEWYRGKGGEENNVSGGAKVMPYVPIRGNLSFYNRIRTDKMLDADTNSQKVAEQMIISMNLWLNQLSHDDPKYPLLQHSVIINEKLLGTDRHKEGVHQATIVNLGPMRIVMVENNFKDTELTLKNNPDWDDYSGKNNIKH